MTEVGDKFTKKLDFSHTGIGESRPLWVKCITDGILDWQEELWGK